MQTHVQCDRCKKYEPTAQTENTYSPIPQPPETWFKVLAFGHPVRVNECYPIGPVNYLLCGDCLPAVKEAIDGAVKRGTR